MPWNNAEALAKANAIANERASKREGNVQRDSRGTPVNSFAKRIRVKTKANGLHFDAEDEEGDDLETIEFGNVEKFASRRGNEGKNKRGIKWPDMMSESESEKSKGENERDSTTKEARTSATAANGKSPMNKAVNTRDSATKKNKKQSLATTIEYVLSSDEASGDERRSEFERLPSKNAGRFVVPSYDDESDETSEEEEERKTKIVSTRWAMPTKSSLKVKSSVVIENQPTTNGGSARTRALTKNNSDEFTRPPESKACCVIS